MTNKEEHQIIHILQNTTHAILYNHQNLENPNSTPGILQYTSKVKYNDNNKTPYYEATITHHDMTQTHGITIKRTKNTNHALWLYKNKEIANML